MPEERYKEETKETKETKETNKSCRKEGRYRRRKECERKNEKVNRSGYGNCGFSGSAAWRMCIEYHR